MLNSRFMCKEYGDRSTDDLLGDPFKFALNTFIRRVGTQHENEGQKNGKEK